MAHSIQAYRGANLILHDADIVVAVSILDGALSEYQVPETGREIVDRWKQEIASSAPGCIDLRFDDLLLVETERCTFRALLKLLHAQAFEFDEQISSSEFALVPNNLGLMLAGTYRRGLIVDFAHKLEQLVD